ncbi:hypothetical protein CHARACLAT_023467 [Characodon lateralis]|uniref:Uncharacterized protein n=1 Tax=Characodon lateralis TaxID=208331 RepID=A0ABU7CRB2_9TELE|nr:hypothetical protein [Characodon lateralis]
MLRQESCLMDGACLTKCEAHNSTQSSSFSTNLNKCLSLSLFLSSSSFATPSTLHFPSQVTLKSPTEGEVPGFIVLSDCLLPVSVCGVLPHTHTHTHTHTHADTHKNALNCEPQC